jgi:pimeloyl-ACP methyl ester carboxylesterase
MKKILCSIACLFLFFQLSGQSSTDQLFDVSIKGSGDPVLLIPGLACSGAVWDETFEKLSAQYECHIFTLAGFAGTQAFPGSDTSFLPKIKKGIIQYIDQQSIKKPVIIGHSLGGFMALSIAAEAPQLLKKIIIVDSYPFYSAAMNPGATAEQARPQAQMMKTMMVNQTAEVFESQQKQSMPTMAAQADDIEKIIQWSLASDRPTVAQAMYELMTTDLRDEAEKVSCPILVFGSWYAAKDYGITSEMVKNNYQQQFQKAKDYKILMADTAKHFIMLDEFDWFMKHVNTFLK